jgi:fluoride ion exporter CrcB/FEX
VQSRKPPVNSATSSRAFFFAPSATGVLGGFTTFSAFSLDAALLWERHAVGQAALYVLGSVGLSILMLFLGMAVFRMAST